MHTQVRRPETDATAAFGVGETVPERDSSNPDVVVHCVHGTFPRGRLRQSLWNIRHAFRKLGAKRTPVIDSYPRAHRMPEKRFWFETGSDFETNVRKKLEPESSRVRFDRFLWSGSNSFSARSKAALGLRSHLHDARQTFPDAKHLILAHSHGGTVAVAALDALGEDCSINGVMTLGTPFVRLVTRGKSGAPSGFDVAVALFLPAVCLVGGPLLSLDVLVRGWGSGTTTVGWTLLALSLFAAAMRHVSLAAIVLGLACLFGGYAVSIDLVPVGIVAIVLVILSGNRSGEPRGLFRSLSLTQSKPFRLPCSLLAVRTPSDEASLAIGVGQGLERGFHLATRGLISLADWLTRPFDWISKSAWFRRSLQVALAVVYLLLLGIVLVLFHHWIWGMKGRSSLDLLLMVIVSPGIYFVIGAVVLILGWGIPGLALSLLTGREAFALPALTGVDAEPLPFAHPESMMTLVIDVEAGQAQASGLNHSSHEVPAIRERIASWIGTFLSARNSNAK